MSYTPYFKQENVYLTFAQIWPTYSDFKTDYDALIVGFPQDSAPLSEDSITTTYYLLYAQYGNNSIANSDIGQFKMKILSVIFAYGPTWEKKSEIQSTLRNLSEDDLLQGSKQIFNHAYNPSSSPSTSELEELTYIDNQNTSNNKKSYMEAYSILWNILRSETASEYIGHFRKCFSVFVDKMAAPFYIGEEDEEI